MDQHFNQIEKIIKERKTSSRIRFMLQDVLDLRKVNGVPWWFKLKHSRSFQDNEENQAKQSRGHREV